MATEQATEYQEQKIMPLARKEGCTCPFDKAAYRAGKWSHKAGCPSPKVECLPNAAKLMAAMRQVY